jgi:hypothetical protein
MAGAGIKKFTVGESLSDVEINTYLMDQTVPVFVNAAARDSAFGESGEPTLSEGRLCYLQSTKVVQFYNGVTWSDSGQFTVADNAITAAKLKSDVVGEEAVITATIRNDAVTADKLADSSSVDLDRAVTTNHIRNNAVTSGKLASNLTLSGITTLSGTGKIQQLIEKAVHSSGALNGQQILNVDNGAIYYYPGTHTGDFSFRITSTNSLGIDMLTHETITVVAFCVQGTTARKLEGITIDALTTGVTVRWFGGSSYPVGNASITGGPSSIDVYTITVMKTAAGFDVFASQSSFKG